MWSASQLLTPPSAYNFPCPKITFLTALLEVLPPVTILYYAFPPSSETELTLPDPRRPRLCMTRADPNLAIAAATPVPP